MLKLTRDGTAWLTTQPDHAQVSGYLAAHWGNDAFAAPGRFAAAADPERLRAETVMGIAEHDNGWREHDATPDLDPEDGLPLNLPQTVADQQVGMSHWRAGIARFAETHPYAALLISYHALWLYRPRIDPDPPRAFRHVLFWKGLRPVAEGEKLAEAHAIVAELEETQRALEARIGADDGTAPWLAPEHLSPHVRLVQLLDALSLSLCSTLIPARDGASRGLGEDAFELVEVPRRSWDDRVTIAVTPSGPGRIALDPYPFDTDPLPVPVVSRAFPADAVRTSRFPTWWHARPLTRLDFTYHSAGT